MTIIQTSASVTYVCDHCGAEQSGTVVAPLGAPNSWTKLNLVHFNNLNDTSEPPEQNVDYLFCPLCVPLVADLIANFVETP